MWQNQTQKSSSFRESIKALEADIQHANTIYHRLYSMLRGLSKISPHPCRILQKCTTFGGSDMYLATFWESPSNIDYTSCWSPLAKGSSSSADLDGDCVQMKVSYGFLAPFLLFLIEWMDYSCLDNLATCLGLLHILVYRVYVDGIPTISPQERKATIREFYAIIYPSLKQLEGNLVELMKENDKITQLSHTWNGEGVEEKRQSCKSIQREEECDICMETGSKVVLPNCGHSMCAVCFHDWYIRSQSCPFCRGSLQRVSSGDLWVLTSYCDVVDSTILGQENLRRFYLYIDKLPLAVPDTNVMLYDYMI